MVIVCIVSILFALFKVLNPSRKIDAYLAIGDYLSVSGNLKGENINSFSSLLGDYLLQKEEIAVSNYSYAKSSIDSATLLEMIFLTVPSAVTILTTSIPLF